jgi:hypothetical protein
MTVYIVFYIVDEALEVVQVCSTHTGASAYVSRQVNRTAMLSNRGT